MFKDKSYKAHEDHKYLYDALQKSLERDCSNQLLSDLEEARQKKRKRRDLPRTPSGSPPSQPPLHLLQQVHLSDDEDFENNYLPKANSRKDWPKPLPKEERPATPELAWTIPFSNVSDVENNWATALVLAYETPDENSLLAKTRDMTNFLNCSRWRSVTRCSHIRLTGRIQKDIKSESINGSSPALSISKMKVASYPDFGLKPLMLEQMWIDDVSTYDISAKYGFSHWWFNRQKFYIDIYDSLPRRKEVRSHMLVSSELKPTQDTGHLDHLPGSDKQMLSTTVKLWTRNLVIRQRVKDFQLVFPIKNNERKIIWFNEIYKFSDSTLTRILEALAYRVKEFKIKQLNLSINTRFWTQKDVTRSKEFIVAIERRLKTIRIYQNLECFIDGRVLDIDFKLLQRTE
uniref:Uncharacterized protein n=1 Tax=Tanacetum cinerariifolium TaxID=118510 RepID=A0A699H8K4_TANCI|nr:hypothetical protein [Tanacetum cinerariifolium]